VLQGDFESNAVPSSGTIKWSGGSSYHGGLQAGSLHGSGQLTLGDGSEYEGTFVNGTPLGRGLHKFSDGATISGDFDAQSVVSSLGFKTWKDGRTYTGELVGGEMEGKGDLTWPDKRKYSGRMVAGRMEGRGKLTWRIAGPDIEDDAIWECCYEGDFLCNRFHGEGKLTLPNGDHYEGSFSLGEFDGQGSFYWSDGSSYEGSWQAGQMEGQGVLVKPDSTTYDGQFVQGVVHGQGLQRFSNGDCYDGEWCETEMHGAGVFSWANGVEYSGQFQHNEPHGSGTKLWPDGTKHVGHFEYGMRWGKGACFAADARVLGTWVEDKVVELLLERIDADGSVYFEGPIPVAQCAALASSSDTNILLQSKATALAMAEDPGQPASLLFSNGESYFGVVDKENVRDGEGLYIRADGTMLSGVWANGELLEAQRDSSEVDPVHNPTLHELRATNVVATERLCRLTAK